MKKLISAILCVALILTFVPQLGFALSTSSSATSASSVLYDLGVVDFENATDSSVTRAEFTRYAMKLADIPVTPHMGTVFDDVTKTHPDYDYIMSAVDFGLISRATNYRPNDYVTINEASKIMITLLGYDYMAEAKGGYPYGYMQTAQAVDLMDGVTIAEGALSQINASIILCNALHIKLPEVTYTAEGASDYRTGSATILSQYRNMEYVTGIVDGNSKYSTSDKSGLGDGKMSIDGVVYNSGKIDANNLFGYEVDAYIDVEKNTVVSCVVTNSNKTLTIYAEDIMSYTSKKFAYIDKNGKEKTVSIDVDTDIFYNGKKFDFDSGKAIPESGSLTFISPNGSNSYSTLLIKSYKTIVVDRISKNDYLIVDKYDKANNLNLHPDKIEYKITSQNGKMLDFESIGEGDVLCVAMSDDGGYAEIICVSDEFMGTYTGKSDNYIQVDGTSYRLTNSLKDNISDTIALGKDAKFRLDMDQRIADIIPASGVNEEIGYLFWGRYSEKGMSKNMYARILKLDETKEMYTFADTFSINGIGYKDCAVAYEAHKSPDYNSLLCGIVKFRLDSDNKIKSLTYADKEGGNGGLYVTQSVDRADEYDVYSQWYNNIGNRIICDTSLKVFKVPNPLYSVDNIDEDMYTIVEPGYLTPNGRTQDYKLVGYTTKPNDALSQYLLMQKIEDDASTDIEVGGQAYMVSTVKKIFYQGEPKEAMELCDEFQSPSSPTIVYSRGENDFSLAGIEGGDLVQVAIGEKDILKGFKVVYKQGKTAFEDGSVNVSSSTSFRLPDHGTYLVWAYNFRGDVMHVVPANIKPENATEANLKPLYVGSSVIHKYDEKRGCLVEASVDDIKDYESFGSDATLLVYHIRTNSHPRLSLVNFTEE